MNRCQGIRKAGAQTVHKVKQGPRGQTTRDPEVEKKLEES